MYIPSFVLTGLRDEDGRSTRGGLSGMGSKFYSVLLFHCSTKKNSGKTVKKYLKLKISIIAYIPNIITSGM
jgi:hypothetical protein